jgi:amino acid adenylation domain-containing protein
LSDLRDRAAGLSPTKRALLERHLQARRSAASPERISRRARGGEPVPLSFAQQRLWFLDQLEPGHSFYNLPLVNRVAGPVDVEQLRRALSEIVRRHEVLRTNFRELDGRPVQVVRPHEHLELPLVDLSHMPAAEREAEAARRVAIEAEQPFDLARDLPFRAALLRLSPADHVLLMTMHHIASDGWSIGILQRELGELLRAYVSDETPDLPDLPLQYADFSVWQRERLRGAVLDDLLGFWRRTLDGMPALLELPLDRPRPRVQVFRGAAYSVTLPMHLLDRMKAVCRRADVTLFVGLLTAFEMLLARYSGRTDIVVGTPVANRTRVETEGLIGFFVNTLVLRTDLGGDPDFLDALERTRKVSLDALGHQELPFEKLVEEIRPERDLSHNPLFQVMFALQNQNAALEIESTAPQFTVGTSKFDLTLSTAETTSGLHAVFEYNSALFDASTVMALAENYQAILEAAVREPERRMSELLSATPAERERVFVDWSAASERVRPAATIHELCERQADLRPDAPALAVPHGEQLTYRQLDNRANQLAAELRARGAGRETRVGVCVARSPEFVVALLGVLKAGAAFVPLDPCYPASRLAYMLADSGADILLTQAELAEELPPHPGTVLRLDADWPAIARRPAAPVPSGAGPDDLAYVVYTSGSTGRPKGVMVPHRGVCNVAEAQAQVFALGGDDRILQFSALGFDAAIFEIVLALRSGATLVLAPNEEVRAGPPLAETLRSERINVITITPSALAVLPEADLPDLHTLIAASESCPADLVARWSPGRRFFNAYGPTEASIWATVAECTDPAAAPPIGRPIPGAQGYVLDERLEPVPAGVPGELYVGGAGVARGYLGKPGLTAERYLPDPFAGAGARMYRTGDRVRHLPDGQLQFLGRLDDQVKVRGYRVELGEIQAALLAHAGVHEAAVLAQDGPEGAARLVACYVADEPPPAASDLRASLKERLPTFMLPTSFVAVEAIPLTENGKVDRRSLLAVAEASYQQPELTGPRPRTDTERAVAAIWCELLVLEEVGLEDDFFALGGHSLLATQVVARLNDAFGIELPLRTVFEASVVADLAGAVDAARSDAPAVAEPAITGLARRVVSVTVDAAAPVADQLGGEVLAAPSGRSDPQ